MNILLTAIALPLIVALPLLVIYYRAKHGHRSKTPFVTNMCAFFGLLVLGTVFCFSQAAYAADAGTAAVAADGLTKGLGYIGAALAVGLSGIGGGIAVGSSSAAALGAISEDETILGKSLIFVGLAEGVALYGLLISFMIISKL